MPIRRKPVPSESTGGSSQRPTDSVETASRGIQNSPMPQINVHSPPDLETPDLARQQSTVPFPPLPVSPAVSQPGTSLQPTASVAGRRSPSPSLTRSRPASVRIRRLPSSLNLAQQAARDAGRKSPDQESRRRSLSAPQDSEWRSPTLQTDLTRQRTVTSTMPPVAENAAFDNPESGQPSEGGDQLQPPTNPRRGRFRRASNAAMSMIGRPRTPGPSNEQTEGNEYDSQVVDLLDVMDPEVSTLSTLTNVQNSLFVPDLGRLINRRPTYTLTRRQEAIGAEIPEAPPGADVETVLSRAPSQMSRVETSQTQPGQEGRDRPESAQIQPTDTEQTRRTSLSSQLDTTHYAVLPHGVVLSGWNDQEKAELNDHVRHQLHSRRAKFKRRMRGFGKYVSKPLGFFVTLYATLITLFGLAWVLFLIGWINVGGRQLYIVNVIDNVLVALFAVMGDGLAPFRAVDTYHMIFIAHYHHLTWRLRREKALPELHNENDLPADRPTTPDIEAGLEEKQEYSVLSPKQQKKLAHHQAKFASSHTFYRPHETTTHHAFPLRLLVAVVVLLDCHSLLQISLGTCTWAISYHHRPFALTTVILCCSITVNITAGILISVGDRKTRKTEVIEQHFRQGLTEHALSSMEKKKGVHVDRPPQPRKPRKRDAWKKMVGLR
ncbi:MAG: hypothetical protein Q9227_007043 [Pyrenula ochraceoflavens]